MKTGDKVRFIHSKDQGIIRRIINDHSIEVEIEDGFVIPAAKKEVVVIAEDEKQRFSSGIKDTKVIKEESEGDIYLAFHPFNDNIYSLFLINDGSFQILYSLYELFQEKTSGVSSGIIEAKTLTKINEYRFKDFESWPEIIIQVIFFKEGKSTIRETIQRRLKFKASSFWKSRKRAPVLNKEAFVYQLSTGSDNVSPDLLHKNLVENTTSISTSLSEKPAEEIDLHIERLINDFSTYKPNELLDIQVAHFEKQLDSAIAHDMDKIIFIHGSGNGTLRNRIQKILSRNKQIKYFEDARKEKFGYGATLVQLK